jgi:hypothetical protein
MFQLITFKGSPMYMTTCRVCQAKSSAVLPCKKAPMWRDEYPYFRVEDRREMRLSGYLIRTA